MKIVSVFLLMILVGSCTRQRDGYESVEGDREVSETTKSAQVFFWEPDEQGYVGDNAPRTCRLAVTGNYSVRTGSSTGYSRCGKQVIRPLHKDRRNTIQAIGSHGDWVKVTGGETKGCPGGYAWIHKGAFHQGDYGKYMNGECGPASMDIRRNPQPPPPAPSPAVSGVRAKSPYNYPFVLDRCYGLKNKGGKGHFGAPRKNGSKRYKHGGCDYYAPTGSSVRAPCNGKVEVSKYHKRAGNMVHVRCDDGNLFKFWHLHSSPGKARYGTRVSTGQVVGGVGKSGNASKQAPHLHVEVVIKGRGRKDPQRLWDCGGDSGK